MTKEGRVISKYIFELRYAPIYTILDKRGYFAENLSMALNTQDADFTAHRIDLYNSDRKIWAFLSATNCGFASINPGSRTFFQDHTALFLKKLFSLGEFSLREILRIGVRSTHVAEFKGTFEELKDSFRSNFIDLKKPAQEIFGAHISDVGLPLNFRSSDINFNTSSGPMERSQLANFFPDVKPDLLPQISLYLDLDYFKDTPARLQLDDIIGDVKKYSELAWTKFTTLKNLIFGQ